MKTKKDYFAGRIELMALNDTEIDSILEVMEEYKNQELQMAEAQRDELLKELIESTEMLKAISSDKRITHKGVIDSIENQIVFNNNAIKSITNQ